MAYSIIKQNNEEAAYYTEYVVDTESEITNNTLPIQPEAATGSTAFAIDTSEVYMLNSKRKWVKI